MGSSPALYLQVSGISSQQEPSLYPSGSCCYRLAIYSFFWVSGVDAVDTVHRNAQCYLLCAFALGVPNKCALC